MDILYPAVFDGTLPYKNQLNRVILFVSEYVITCHTSWLDRAFQNKTYAYQFSVPPGVHAQDTEYTFYSTTDAYRTYNATVEQALQHYITSFAKTGTPSGNQGGFPAFPAYANGTLLDLTDTGFKRIRDTTANQRCLYFPLMILDKNATSYTPLHAPATNGSNPGWGKSFLGTVLAALVGFMTI